MPRGSDTPKLSRVTIFFPPHGEELVHEVRRLRAASANGYEAPLSELWREALMRGISAMREDLEPGCSPLPRRKAAS